VNAVDGSIGYVGPDGVDATSNAVVARVNGVQPTSLNVTLALSSVPLHDPGPGCKPCQLVASGG
jgi:hypothetical protein